MQTAVLIISCHILTFSLDKFLFLHKLAFHTDPNTAERYETGTGAVNEPAKKLKLFSWKSAQTHEIKILSRPNSKDVKSPWTMSFPGMDVWLFESHSKVLAMTGLLDRKHRPLENRQFVTVVTVKRGLVLGLACLLPTSLNKHPCSANTVSLCMVLV